MRQIATHRSSPEPYPERRAGGFTRFDGTVAFYLRINALLRELGPDSNVLDFGAGRGATLEYGQQIHRDLMDLRPRARRVIGVDIDDTVLHNPLLTEAYTVRDGEALPLDDDSVDLVVADHTFEHLRHPAPVAAELRRVLREGGWICARTPNKWGYTSIGARAIPDRLHLVVLRRLQPLREAHDVFPTWYRLNTPGALAEYFPPSLFDHVMLGWEPEPGYAGSSRIMASVFRQLGRITPERFRPVLLIFLQLRAA